MWKRDASNMQLSSPLTQLVVVSYSSFSNIQTPSDVLNHSENSHRNVLNHWVFLSFFLKCAISQLLGNAAKLFHCTLSLD